MKLLDKIIKENEDLKAELKLRRDSLPREDEIRKMIANLLPNISLMRDTDRIAKAFIKRLKGDK